MTLVVQMLHHTIREAGGSPAQRGWNEVLAEQLAKRYSDLQIECWGPDSAARSETFWTDDNGVVHRLFPSIHIRYGIELSPRMLGRVRSLARLRPLLHLHGVFNLNTYSLSSLYGRELTILAQFHDPVEAASGFLGPIRPAARHVALRGVARFLVPSEHQKGLLPGWMRGRAEAQPFGVDLSAFRPLSKSSERSRLGLGQELSYGIFVGRLVPSKGVRQLLYSVPIIAGRLRNFHLLVAGGGPLSRELALIAKSMGVSDRVHFLGWVENSRLSSYLSAADVLIHPSLREAGPLVALESLACNTPVISTPVGFVPELARNIGGILTIQQPSPWVIADSVVVVCRDPQALASRIARGGLLSYGWDRVSTRLAEMYSGLG